MSSLVNGDSVIKVEGLYKKFCINQRKSMLYGGLDVFRSMIGFPQRRDTLRNMEIWALEDINFEVKSGETLGIVGVNGAGKSTLLRVLSGIYPPDAGKVRVKGTIGALIAAGAGFHPDMTGRENIYLNGAIVGLRKREIDRKLEEIVEFAELGEFIDTPVRFYSTGMYVRLGFSIAVNIRPDILVIDEVLSVGDLTFQNKCFRKLKELRESVDAVIFVSHNLDHIRNVCSSVIMLDAGKIKYCGDVEEGIIRYQAHTDDLKKRSADIEGEKARLPGAASFEADAKLEKIEIGSPRESVDDEIREGDDVVIKLGFSLEREISRPQFTIGIRDDRDIEVMTQRDHDNGVRFEKLEPGSYQLKIVLKQLALVPGLYKVNFALIDVDSCEVLTVQKKFASFIIRGNKVSRAIVNCKSVWELERNHAVAHKDAQEKYNC
ncbi:ATP-binding cassette domain-containing protein [Candidatus Poribacteria bacterium]|nr:ATP-binding cassette domain-containing protein [Candidatus Poribacteria bacterium]